MWEGQPSVDGAAPGQMAVSGIRKQVEQAAGRKPVRNVLLWLLLQFLLGSSYLDFKNPDFRMNYQLQAQINPFLQSWCFITMEIGKSSWITKLKKNFKTF